MASQHWSKLLRALAHGCEAAAERLEELLSESKAPRKPKEEEITEIKGSPLIGPVKKSLAEDWWKTYGGDFVMLEIKKAYIWAKANSQKAPKSAFARFYSSWLSRAWEKERKAIPGKSVPQVKDPDKAAGYLATKAIEDSNGGISIDEWGTLKSGFLAQIQKGEIDEADLRGYR